MSNLLQRAKLFKRELIRQLPGDAAVKLRLDSAHRCMEVIVAYGGGWLCGYYVSLIELQTIFTPQLIAQCVADRINKEIERVKHG